MKTYTLKIQLIRKERITTGNKVSLLEEEVLIIKMDSKQVIQDASVLNEISIHLSKDFK